MGRKLLAIALALLIPLSAVARLSESWLDEENGKQSIGSSEDCPLLPCMTRIAGEGDFWRVASGAGKFQFIDSRVLGLGRRSMALSSSLAHSWPIPLALNPQSLRVKLQV
jgi:hypothetical protein